MSRRAPLLSTPPEQWPWVGHGHDSAEAEETTRLMQVIVDLESANADLERKLAKCQSENLRLLSEKMETTNAMCLLNVKYAQLEADTKMTGTSKSRHDSPANSKNKKNHDEGMAQEVIELKHLVDVLTRERDKLKDDLSTLTTQRSVLADSFKKLSFEHEELKKKPCKTDKVTITEPTEVTADVIDKERSVVETALLTVTREREAFKKDLDSLASRYRTLRDAHERNSEKYRKLSQEHHSGELESKKVRSQLAVTFQLINEVFNAANKAGLLGELPAVMKTSQSNPPELEGVLDSSDNTANEDYKFPDDELINALYDKCKELIANMDLLAKPAKSEQSCSPLMIDLGPSESNAACSPLPEPAHMKIRHLEKMLEKRKVGYLGIQAEYAKLTEEHNMLRADYIELQTRSQDALRNLENKVVAVLSALPLTDFDCR